MKRLRIIIIATLFIVFMASQAYAAWTLTPTRISQAGHLLKWQVVCTSDASALSATDLIALMPDNLKGRAQGSLMLTMTVKPGTAGVIPNTTINVTLSNDEDHTIYSASAFSKDAVTVGAALSEDYGEFLPVYGVLKLALNDIGDAGDQVTLIFNCYIP